MVGAADFQHQAVVGVALTGLALHAEAGQRIANRQGDAVRAVAYPVTRHNLPDGFVQQVQISERAEENHVVLQEISRLQRGRNLDIQLLHRAENGQHPQQRFDASHGNEGVGRSALDGQIRMSAHKAFQIIFAVHVVPADDQLFAAGVVLQVEKVVANHDELGQAGLHDAAPHRVVPHLADVGLGAFQPVHLDP